MKFLKASCRLLQHGFFTECILVCRVTGLKMGQEFDQVCPILAVSIVEYQVGTEN